MGSSKGLVVAQNYGGVRVMLIRTLNFSCSLPWVRCRDPISPAVTPRENGVLNQRDQQLLDSRKLTDIQVSGFFEFSFIFQHLQTHATSFSETTAMRKLFS